MVFSYPRSIFQVRRLEEKGNLETAAGILEQKAWSGALQKAEGGKVSAI